MRLNETFMCLEREDNCTIHLIIVFLLHGLLFLLIQINIRSLDPNNGLVQQPESLLDMLRLNLKNRNRKI